MDFISQILYINILVDWSLSGIMTSKLVIRESESDFTNECGVHSLPKLHSPTYYPIMRY